MGGLCLGTAETGGVLSITQFHRHLSFVSLFFSITPFSSGLNVDLYHLLKSVLLFLRKVREFDFFLGKKGFLFPSLSGCTWLSRASGIRPCMRLLMAVCVYVSRV